MAIGSVVLIVPISFSDSPIPDAPGMLPRILAAFGGTDRRKLLNTRVSFNAVCPTGAPRAHSGHAVPESPSFGEPHGKAARSLGRECVRACVRACGGNPASRRLRLALTALLRGKWADWRKSEDREEGRRCSFSLLARSSEQPCCDWLGGGGGGPESARPSGR